MTKLTVVFRNFANAPKNVCTVHASNFKRASSRLFVITLRDMANKIIACGKIALYCGIWIQLVSLSGHFPN